MRYQKALEGLDFQIEVDILIDIWCEPTSGPAIVTFSRRQLCA